MATLTSLQVCMESDWLQGAIHEDSPGMDSSSPSGEMLTCSRPLMERRLRPPHDQALKCPRCESTHTKFCYYNNYSLTQPRYFCKTCRRYWTKGGTLRNIPVGGGCRKNKKVSSKKTNENHQPNGYGGGQLLTPGSSMSSSPTDLQLSFPDFQMSHLTNMMGSHGGVGFGNPSFMENKYNAMLENPNPSRAIDFMESGNPRNHDFMGNVDQMGMVGPGGIGDHGQMSHGLAPNYFHALCSPFGGMSVDQGNSGSNGPFMLPYHEGHEDQNISVDVKPNTKLLSLGWHDQGCSDAGNNEHSFGYLNGLGSWTGLMNGYGPSATNPLV